MRSREHHSGIVAMVLVVYSGATVPDFHRVPRPARRFSFGSHYDNGKPDCQIDLQHSSIALLPGPWVTVYGTAFVIRNEKKICQE
jgi:hypothetical protein